MTILRYCAPRGLALLAALAACFPAPAPSAQTPAVGPVVVFLVRHAEKAGNGGDPPLAPAGERRASELARVLASAGVTRVHSTDFLRTRETARPLAVAMDLEIRLYDPNDLPGMASRLRASTGRHLVVGHSNTTAELVALLGGDGGAPIDEALEYDRFYTVVLQPGTAPVTVLQRYGDPAP